TTMHQPFPHGRSAGYTSSPSIINNNPSESLLKVKTHLEYITIDAYTYPLQLQSTLFISFRNVSTISKRFVYAFVRNTESSSYLLPAPTRFLRSSTWENVNISTCSTGELSIYDSGTFAEVGYSELELIELLCCHWELLKIADKKRISVSGEIFCGDSDLLHMLRDNVM
ncbi:2808_t:CDS:2, partial [Funneliformis mosseae]